MSTDSKDSSQEVTTSCVKTVTQALKKKSKRGRPTQFKVEMIDQIEVMTKAGKTDAEIAKELDISRYTLHKWKKRSVKLVDTIKDWKAEADGKVEASLYERARGYSHPEEKVFYDSKSGEVVRADTVRHYPPDPTSMIFWLKNRRPKDWADRQEITGKDGEALKLIVCDYRDEEPKE